MKVYKSHKISILGFIFLLIAISASAWDTPVQTSPANSSQSWNFIIFDWNPVVNSVAYQIQYDTSASFNTALLVDSVIPYIDNTGYGDTHLDIDELYFGTTYFWRVRAYIAGDTSAWSTVWSVQTRDDIELVSPVMSAETYVKVQLDWNSHVGIDYYYYQVDTSVSFNSPILISGIDSYFSDQNSFYDTEQNIENLRYGKTYHWRICAVNAIDTSAWTSGTFLTKDNVELNWPVSGNAAFTGLKIDWLEFQGTHFFDFQIDNTPGFNSPLLISGTNLSLNNGSNSSDTEEFIDNLFFGTTYFWRVRSRNGVDTSSWSAESFITTDKVDLSSPVSGSNTGCTVNLDWDAHAGVDFYQYQIDNTPTFNSPGLISGSTVYINEMNSNNDTHKQIAPLDFGVTYYWRVRALNAADTSLWSDVWTLNTLETVVLNSPSAFASTHTSLVLDWDDFAGVNEFEIMIDTSSLFNSSYLINTSSLGSSEKNISNLRFGLNYFWKVRGVTSVDTSDWSEIRQFYTLDNVGLFYPLNGQMNIDTIGVLLDWWHHTGANDYELELDTSNLFNTSFLIQQSLNYLGPISSGTDTEYQLNQLDDDKIYFWRVRIINEVDTSLWETRWFSTGDIPLILPGIPSLLSPFHNETEVDINPLLDWTDVTGVTGYYYEYSHSSTFEQSETGFSPLSQVNLTSLNYLSEYFWRVRSFDGNLGSGWSAVFHFTTEQEVLLAPVLLLPHNGDSGQVTDNLHLDWEDVYHADSYELVYSPFANFLFDVVTLISIPSESTISGLIPGTTYFWKVRALSDTLINSNFSSVWSFTTQLQLQSPVLISPLNNSFNNTYNNLNLTWEGVANSNGYKLQYAKDMYFTVDVINEITNTTYFIIPDLEPETGYYWRVLATSTVYYDSEFSDYWYFSTIEDTSSSIITVSAEELNIYPNPSSGKFFVNIPCNGVSEALIRVFDQTGRIILDDISTGELNVIDLTYKDPGVYFISVICNNTSFTGRIIKTQ